MLLAIDVGNTNIVLGVYDSDQLVQRFRVQTRSGQTADETGALLRELFRHRNLPAEADGAIIACVVPDQLPVMIETCRSTFGCDPLVVGPGVKTGIPILADNPREVGADRIVNSVAAFALIGGPCVVVDFGTATTFDCVSAKGEYLGGVIAPGYQISAEALYRNTSKLPRVGASKPPKVIGKNTVHSMQSGLYYGYVSLVDGLVDRILEEFPKEPRVTCLATGGLASTIAESSDCIDRVVNDLTLDGLRILFDLNTDSG
jgi:type III pantothenate kinase